MLDTVEEVNEELSGDPKNRQPPSLPSREAGSGYGPWASQGAIGIVDTTPRKSAGCRVLNGTEKLRLNPVPFPLPFSASGLWEGRLSWPVPGGQVSGVAPVRGAPLLDLTDCGAMRSQIQAFLFINHTITMADF